LFDRAKIHCPQKVDSGGCPQGEAFVQINIKVVCRII
jgi:hypothetical protein